MFWTEEDIQPAVNAATKVFGTSAQYHLDPCVYVSVETPRYGCIWYGDVTGDFGTVREHAMALIAKLGDKIIVREMGTSNIII
jgi:hypothetical protein